MALKESNKNRKKNLIQNVIVENSTITEDLSWTPLYGLAKKETEQDLIDVQNTWKPIPKIHKET